MLLFSEDYNIGYKYCGKKKTIKASETDEKARHIAGCHRDCNSRLRGQRIPEYRVCPIRHTR